MDEVVRRVQVHAEEVVADEADDASQYEHHAEESRNRFRHVVE
jgi:hypothetical protein